METAEHLSHDFRGTRRFRPLGYPEHDAGMPASYTNHHNHDDYSPSTVTVLLASTFSGIDALTYNQTVVYTD
jgi:hypothetical protein